MRRVLVLAVSLAAFHPGPASAVTVSGQVVDEDGFGIFNVDLDFEDLSTGQIVFTPFDNTDAGGFYSVDVPVGEYEVFFNAPAGSPYLSDSIKPVNVTGPMTLNTFLYYAQLLTGTVTNTSGQPLASVDLNFFDSVTGDEYGANNDNSNASGVFSVFVPGLTWDIYFTPPAGMPYAGKVIFSVAVAGTTSLGTIELEDAFLVTADVQDPAFQPVQNTDTDFIDLATDEEIYTPRDNTDNNGHLQVYVPTGAFDVIVNSPPGSGLAWKTVYDVAVGGPVNLGVVQLENGFNVTGTLRDELAAPVSGADLDMKIRATGNDLPTPDDNANAAGQFSLFPPASTFDLWIKPPAGSGVASHVVRDVSVAAPLNLGVITVPTGHPITGTVRNVLGELVAGANIDAAELATGFAHPLVGDHTDATGTYSTRLPAGSWILTAMPPPGSALMPATAVVDPLAGPVVVDFVLPSNMVGVEATPLAGAHGLLPNVPNPFRASTRVVFELARPESEARLAVYDLAGRRVRELWTGATPAGRHSVSWDGRDGRGARVAAGVYLVRLESSSGPTTRKVTLLR